MKNILRILVALVAGASCVSVLAAVTATLNRDRVALGETVQLMVQSDGRVDGQPDTAPLRQDFDVLGSSRSTSLQIVNGHSSSQTQVSLLLAPKHAGTLRIPPLQWDGQQSPPLTLTVGGNGGGKNANGNGNNNGSGNGNDSAAVGSDTVFLTATPDNRQPYVQAPVVLTVRLYAAAQLDQASLDLQGNSDVLVKQIGKDRQSSQLRNGQSYQVVERRYLLIPQRSGHISLNGPVLDAQVQDPGGSGFPDLDAMLRNAFGRNPLGAAIGVARPLHLTGNTIELDVLPRPAAATGPNWLPAQKLTLQESWQPEHGEIHVGEPVTRHLHLAAVGLTGTQLPDLAALMAPPDGIKTYPDQAKVDEGTDGGTVTGNRDQDIAFIAARPGHYVLPAVSLAWWDTAAKVLRKVELPARPLDVLPAAGAPANAGVPAAPPVSPAPSPRQPAISSTAPGRGAKPAAALPWQWASAAFALLWLGTLAAWWISRRRLAKAGLAGTGAPVPAARKKAVREATPAKPAPDSALRELQRACRDNDPQAARQHVLAWAAGFWPDAPPRGLNDVARRLADAKFSQPLQELDRACYSGIPWNGEALAAAFAGPPQRGAAARPEPEIPDLYS